MVVLDMAHKTLPSEGSHTATFTSLLNEELEKATLGHEVERPLVGAPWMEMEPKLENPDRWVVDLYEPFRQVARGLAEGRNQAGQEIVLAGAHGSGKSLLLALVHHIAEVNENLSGILEPGVSLLGDEQEGEQRIERLSVEWRRRRLKNNLHYLIVDDAPWTQVIAGRINQLRLLFQGQPPTMVYGLSLFALEEIRWAYAEGEKRFRIVRIPPYDGRDLRDLWHLHFSNIEIPDNLLDDIVEHALGNPGLLLHQGQAIADELRNLGQQAVSEHLLERLWERAGYQKALRIRREKSLRGNQLQILARICAAGGATATQLSKQYDLDRSLCSYHLSQLKKEDLLMTTRRGPEVFYEALLPVRVSVETFEVGGYD